MRKKAERAKERGSVFADIGLRMNDAAAGVL